MSWYCSCGLLNSGLNKSCADQRCNQLQATANKPDFLQTLVVANGVNSMTPQEELFAKFYNHEKILVKDMETSQLREHRDELSHIAFEAKARLVAADDEGRERKAKTSNKEWLITSIEPDAISTDAINAIKVRKERMSKMDKLRSQLLTAGIDEVTVNEMVANLEKKATEKNLKTVTFNKPTVETSVIQVQVVKPKEENGEVKPAFNPSSLSFSK